MAASGTAPESNQMLRHTVATLAYRAGKALRGVPPNFADFTAAPGIRTPVQLLAHMSDVLQWATRMASGDPDWRPSAPLSWEEEVQRFFRSLEALDQRLASAEPLAAPADHLFSGPIADTLTHTGQLLMLRRMAGTPIRSENYFGAQITAGRVGVDQAAPVFEFD